eukprot:5166699-Prymnesium_polylepis.1
MLESARLTACRIGVGPSPRAKEPAVFSSVQTEPPLSSPPPPQQLNVKTLPYFQSVRGRAL